MVLREQPKSEDFSLTAFEILLPGRRPMPGQNFNE